MHRSCSHCVAYTRVLHWFCKKPKMITGECIKTKTFSLCAVSQRIFGICSLSTSLICVQSRPLHNYCSFVLCVVDKRLFYLESPTKHTYFECPQARSSEIGGVYNVIPRDATEKWSLLKYKEWQVRKHVYSAENITLSLHGFLLAWIWEHYTSDFITTR